MKMPKSFWPEYLALGLFVAGPVGSLIVALSEYDGADAGRRDPPITIVY